MGETWTILSNCRTAGSSLSSLLSMGSRGATKGALCGSREVSGTACKDWKYLRADRKAKEGDGERPESARRVVCGRFEAEEGRLEVRGRCRWP